MGSNITLSSGAFSNLSDCLGAISDQEIIKNATISIPNKNKSTNYSFYHIKDTHRYQQVVNITITTNLGEYSVRECYDAKAKNSKIAFRSFLGYDKALLNKLTGNLGESAAELKSRVLPFLNTKQVIKGKSDNEAKEIIDDFLRMIKENPELKSTILEEDDKTKLMCLSGVKQYPMRVKCATLSWHTLISAMEDDGNQVSTED